MKKKQIVENLATDIGYNIHVGLRKWIDCKGAHAAWKAISELPEGEWKNLCGVVANNIYPEMRKAFFKQFIS